MTFFEDHVDFLIGELEKMSIEEFREFCEKCKKDYSDESKMHNGAYRLQKLNLNKNGSDRNVSSSRFN